ncbi:MAG: hypothetical protein ACR2O5_03945 [Thiogranum sp.]
MTHIIRREVDSTCDNGTAWDGTLDGITDEGNRCLLSAACEGNWPITDGKWSCSEGGRVLVTGVFTSVTTVAGRVLVSDIIPDLCLADWAATPD